MRTAFANALLAVAQSSSGNVKLANFLLSSWESGDAPPSQATNIVHAQALLLLLIDADWRGSSTLPALLGRAVSLASTMKLWRYAAPQPGSDPDSDDNLGMRIWWSLVLMDRWHAVGTGSPVMIPDTSVVMPPGLDSVLGETCARLLRKSSLPTLRYASGGPARALLATLARPALLLPPCAVADPRSGFSKVQSRISQLVVSLPPGTTTGDPLVTRMLSDYVEDQRETLPAHIQPDTHPLVFLAYWHCRILATLLRDYHWAELMGPTRELVALLSANADMRNPLANHFGFLVAMALSRLARHGVDDDRNPALSSDANPPAPRAEAVQLMRDVLDRPGSVWDAIRDRLADQQAAATSSGGRPDTAESGVDAASLQRLADLATGHNHDIAPPHDQTAEDADAAEPLSLVQGYLAIS